MPQTDPFQPADAAIRAAARALLAASRHATLAWTDPADGNPGISRIAFGLDPETGPLALISALAAHSAALRAQPACALLLEPAIVKGDPMASPRLTLRATARILPRDAPEQTALRVRWRTRNPKASVYLDLPDFSLVQLIPQSGLYNGGFGRACRLTPADLAP